MKERFSIGDTKTTGKILMFALAVMHSHKKSNAQYNFNTVFYIDANNYMLQNFSEKSGFCIVYFQCPD